jgi:trimethylamine:corrinoid methyltransferase-like protein
MGSPDTFERAKVRVAEILAAYKPPDLPPHQVAELQNMVSGLAKAAGMDQLPVF